jgi:hypothetical protein
VVADAALEGAQDVAVLDAVALEELHLARVHAHGEVHDDLVLGLRQHGLDGGVEVHHPGRLGQVVLDDHFRAMAAALDHPPAAPSSAPSATRRGNAGV